MEKLGKLSPNHQILIVSGLLKMSDNLPLEATPTCTYKRYRKNSKIWDTSNNGNNCPKNRKVCCNIALMHPKDADGMANSVDPDQTASSEAV